MQGTPSGYEPEQEPALFLFADTAEPVERAERADLADPPIARVQLETSVPHLDRPFDYLVPKDMGDAAQPGVRVRAKFGHQFLNGYVLERLDSTSTEAQLQLLDRVVSPHKVLPPGSYTLGTLVASRFAGTVSDVIRSAVPTRVASVDKAYEPEEPRDFPDLDATFDFSLYSNELGNIGKRIGAGDHIRTRVLTPQRFGENSWMQYILALVGEVSAGGRGLIVVVPDQQNLDQLDQTLKDAGLEDFYVRLTSEDGPTPRYRAFLKVVNGDRSIVIGTRSAIFAPVQNLGLVVVVDDPDSNHSEPRAPYWNTRDVALLRTEHEDCSLVLVGWRHSLQSQRMVKLGYLEDFEPLREAKQELYPRVIVTADEYYQQREYGPGSHRIPSVAWQVMTRALTKGPVLVQVARTGFIPAVRCIRCGTQARCLECTGPLGYKDHRSTETNTLVCRWCGRHEHKAVCQECSSTVFKAAHRGAERTAEELGRAFANVPVISSAGEHIKTAGPNKSALVVATPGAEPVAPEGYAATVLLDGNTMLAREGLDTPEQVFGRWVAAVALTKSHRDDGLCVITADPHTETNTLARLDVPGYFGHVYEHRQAAGLPPARRLAAVEADPATLKEFLQHFQSQLSEPVDVIGPTPMDEEGTLARALLFFTYRSGNEVSAALRGSKASFSAHKKLSNHPLRIRIDPESVL